LIYHSSFIGKTGAKSKGRISRFLANKCSIASRIDNFSETPTSKFGEALKRQVDERIEFYASGAPPAKNSAVMQAAMNAVMTDIGVVEDPTAAAAEDVEMADGVTAAATEQAVRKEKKEKKDKKEKKEKKAKTEEVSEKKEKKDKKRKSGDDDGEKKKKKSKA
jgi:nucleolar protein 56